MIVQRVVIVFDHEGCPASVAAVEVAPGCGRVSLGYALKAELCEAVRAAVVAELERRLGGR